MQEQHPPELVSDVPFYAPRTLPEALELRQQLGTGARVVAGGTDVMVWQGGGRVPLPSSYLSLWGIKELRGVTAHEDRLEIGALTTYTDLIRSPEVNERFPDLVEASRQIGALQIQNRGTLGGNVVNASPAGDSLPVLAVHDAVLVLESQARGARKVPFSQFYTGYRKSVMEADELLTHIELPYPPSDAQARFAKVGSRRAQTISKVMASIKVRFDEDGRFSAVALAFGSVAPVIVRMPQTEAAMIGHLPSPSLVDRLEPVLQREITPINDVRSDAEYRRFLAAGLLRRFMRTWEPEGSNVVEWVGRGLAV